MDESCLFCRIAAKEIPAQLVAESDEIVAFRDVNPQAPLHVLVVPKSHVRSLADARDPQLLGRLLAFAAQIARDEGVEKEGYRVIVNTNASGGQTVFHLHLHVLGGRRMTWPPG